MNHMIPSGQNEPSRENEDDQGECPLNFAAETTEPQNRHRDDDRRRHCAKNEPGQFALMRKPIAIFGTTLHSSENLKTENGNRKYLEPILLQAPVKRAAA